MVAVGHQRLAQSAHRVHRVRGDQDFGVGAVSLEIEAGRATEPAALARTFTDVSVGARHTLDRGALAVWTDRYSGGSITKGADGTVTVGGDASMRVSRTTDFMVTGYATRLSTEGAEWHSQLDAQIGYRLPNGNSLTLRARLSCR